jgi:predicted HTH domain antitoxin
MERVDIDTELVIDMYVNQGMSLRKIGKIFDVNYHTIAKRLEEKNITIKTSRETIEKQVDIEKMVDMYVNQRINSREIGKKLNIGEVTVQNKLKQLGVKKRNNREAQTIELDIVRLEDMYVNQKMSSTKIGEIMGVHPNTILKNLKILGIPIRSKSEATALASTQKKKDYSRSNMSTRNIVGRGSSCIEHQHFSGGPNLGNQTPIRKRLGGNSPNPTTI